MNVWPHSNVVLTDRPDPPSGKPTVSDIEEDSCRVEWQVPPHDGGASIVSYTLHKQEVTSSGKWERVGSTHLTHLTVHRLKENKQYRWAGLYIHVHLIKVWVAIPRACPNMTLAVKQDVKPQLWTLIKVWQSVQENFGNVGGQKSS